MNIKDKVKKSFDSFLVATPIWGLGACMLISALKQEYTPHRNIEIDNKSYRVERHDESISVILPRQMTYAIVIDKNQDGIADEYFLTIGAPRMWPATGRWGGKDIPQNIQDEYKQLFSRL